MFAVDMIDLISELLRPWEKLLMVQLLLLPCDRNHWVGSPYLKGLGYELQAVLANF